MGFYEDWGFRVAPFKHEPLPPTVSGSRLLLGRDEETVRLSNRVNNGNKLAALEGINGVGKTSIANVAAFRLYQQHLAGSGPLYLPCKHKIQLDAEKSSADFYLEVMTAVAQTLISRPNDLLKTKGNTSTKQLDRWLNQSESSTKSFGLQIGLVGASVSEGKSPNTGAGFMRTGFVESVKTLLGTIFTEEEGGGVICTIDNLELLKETTTARDVLERLRDTLFAVQGLRFILCGSHGIIRGVLASAPRMSGYLHEPIEVTRLGDEYAEQIFNKRVEEYKQAHSLSPYLPLDGLLFSHLYSTLKRNLRDTLSKADNYCEWIAEQQSVPHSPSEKQRVFLEWLDEVSLSSFKEVEQDIASENVFKIFTYLAKHVEMSPHDFKQSGVLSPEEFAQAITTLSEIGLITTYVDPDNSRRKTIVLTPKACLVNNWIHSPQSSESADF